MHRLESNLQVLDPVIGCVEHFLPIHAYADGRMPGWAYVDNLERPRSAFAFTSEGWFLAGDADNQSFNAEVRRLITDEVIPTSRQWGEDGPLHFWPIAWLAAREVLLAGIPHRVGCQHYFVFRGAKVDWRACVRDGCTVRPVDAGTLADESRTPVPGLRRWAAGGFGSVEAYCEESLGMCAEHDGRMVSWCMPDCATGDRCELGVHTVQDMRGKGLATAVVAATLERCLAHGYRHIGWHCWRGNQASAGLAQKVGFEYVLDHPAFIVETGE